jgi:hypothetical protein
MDINNKLVVTIAIQMHGSIFAYELTNETSNIFENVRLLCGAGGFKNYQTNFVEELVLVESLKNYFAHDIDESKSTFDMLQETKNGTVIGNITFDKILSVGSYLDVGGYIDGVYLISIHRGKKLMYPTNPNDNINLLNITDLNRLSSIFKTKMPNIEQLSSNFPDVKIYIDEINNINKNSNLIQNEKTIKIEEIRKQLYNSIGNWNLTLGYFRKKIEIIKLSVLIKIVKDIISHDCIINLLDYSCNKPSNIIPNEQNTLAKYAIMPYDPEQGISNTKLGGKKYCRKGHKKSHKKRRHRKTTKKKQSRK